MAHATSKDCEGIAQCWHNREDRRAWNLVFDPTFEGRRIVEASARGYPSGLGGPLHHSKAGCMTAVYTLLTRTEIYLATMGESM